MSSQLYEATVKEIRAGVDYIIEGARKFPWDNRECYAHWLTQTYHYVVHSTRFAAMAAAFSPPDDQFFHYEFMAGVKEENGHDLLALNDLKRLGFKLGEFKELTETATFYQTLTYYMFRESHFAVLGYSTPLEGFAALALKPIYESARALYGANATSFMRVHCEADQDHFKGAMEMIAKCPEKDLLIIHKASRQAAYIYRSIFDAIVKDLEVSQQNNFGRVDLMSPG